MPPPSIWPRVPFPRREYWVFGHSASALNGHLCLLPPLLALWIKYTCHVTLHSTATDLWWSSGGRNCFCVGFQPTKSMSVSIFWTHPENPPPLHLRWGVVGGANAIRKRDRTALIWNQAILTRDNTNHYDDDKNRVAMVPRRKQKSIWRKMKKHTMQRETEWQGRKSLPHLVANNGPLFGGECVCKKLAWQPRDRSSQHPNQITICFKSDQADKKSKQLVPYMLESALLTT